LLGLDYQQVQQCYTGMTPEEIAEVRPRLLDFTAEMLGGLPRKDQRAAGELYVRGLLTDGQRKSGVSSLSRGVSPCSAVGRCVAGSTDA
jgi:hypothetical protein